MAACPLLVVDDERLFRSALADSLRADGYRVIQAGDGVEALAVLRSTEVSVVVTDLTMPIMDGLALLHALKHAGLRVPTIVVSALDDPRAAAEAITSGAASFMGKPIDYDALLRRVDELTRGEDREAGRRGGAGALARP